MAPLFRAPGLPGPRLAGSPAAPASRFPAGGPVMRVWVAGIAVRFGTGVLVWLFAALAGVPTRELMIAYGLALSVFLIVEAGWLAVTTSKTTSGST